MQFEIRALRGAEGLVTVALEAPDETSALEQARAQGLAVLSARPRRALPALASPFAARFPLLLFSQELVALLSAGLSLPEVVETLAEKEARPEFRRIFAALRASLYEGRSFSQSLERFPETFPSLYVATVRAAERTGDIAEALGRYISYHERLDAVRRKVVSACVYPAVLLGVGGLVVLFLLGYVVPRFAGVYEEVGRDLPWLSRLLIEWGKLINTNGALLAVVLVAAIVAAGLGFGRLKQLAGRVAQRIPAIGERLRVYHLARLYRTLGMLLRGGTPLVTALGMVAGLMPAGMRTQLAAGTQRIREGASISAGMEAAELTTPVAVRLLRVGERSGEMAEMMDRIAVFHDEELARWIDLVTKLFEPLLMAAIGVVIGAIVVLMYLPIFELAGSLQ
ncbi:MAG TPA: type II secretion system F family protein [Burkholderiales bacterium]|nr:type II secretion system F family protein [Burkholderiales bacterium]